MSAYFRRGGRVGGDAPASSTAMWRSGAPCPASLLIRSDPIGSARVARRLTAAITDSPPNFPAPPLCRC